MLEKDHDPPWPGAPPPPHQLSQVWSSYLGASANENLSIGAGAGAEAGALTSIEVHVTAQLCHPIHLLIQIIPRYSVFLRRTFAVLELGRFHKMQCFSSQFSFSYYVI